MPGSFARVGSLLFVGVLTVSAGGGQPPGDPKDEPKLSKAHRPAYTAFPDLKPPISEQVKVNKADGSVETVVVEKGAVPLPPWPTAAADAPPLRKLQFEQLEEGRAYVARCKEILRIGSITIQFIRDYFDMTVEVYRLAAEMEDKPAKRVPWYEARVRKLKEFEQLIVLRVGTGSSPPQDLDMARFRRLQAEIDLTKLRAEVEKAGAK
jgi:hypothetical protein